MFTKLSLSITLLIFTLLLGCNLKKYRNIPAKSERMCYLLFPAAGQQEPPSRAIIVNGRELHTQLQKYVYYLISGA